MIPERFPRTLRKPRVLVGLIAATAVCGLAPSAMAAEPANQHDPCASAGRDTCGTTGVGSYQHYRYGIRWFGDYRHTGAGIPPAFCIDLRFWYPGRQYKYRTLDISNGLKNKAGQTVPVGKQQRMAYALWNFGRSGNANQQAAVMLYVHGLMNDGAPGEVASNSIGATVQGIYNRIGAEADRYHGPYRLVSKLASSLKVGVPATATVRVLAASGAAVPNLRINLQADGAKVPGSVRTDAKGVATVQVTPTQASGISIDASSAPVASDLPVIYKPTAGASAANGQRLATGDSQVVSGSISSQVSKTSASVTSIARPNKLLVGQASRDRVTVAGLPPGRSTTLQILMHGPFRTTADINCTTQPPAATTSLKVSKSGTYNTPVVKPAKPGIYTYQIVIAGTENFTGITTKCGEPSETLRVETQPAIHTQASTARSTVGQPLTDTAVITGLNGEAATAHISLYGPFSTQKAVSCNGAPIWTGDVAANGDGSYVTQPFTPTVAGFYTYRESLDAAGFVRSFDGKCGVASEGVVVAGSPQITSQISALQLTPGADLTDRVIVQGMGALSTTINMQLWGPYATADEMTCSGTPAWQGTITADIGDGLHVTQATKPAKVGIYTYTASIAESDTNTGVATRCGDPAETVQVTAQPTITTVASAAVIRPGGQIADKIKITGLGTSPATVDLSLYGPFATKAAISCSGAPVWHTRFGVDGDGLSVSPTTTLAKAGFYIFHEKLLAAPGIQPAEGVCGEAAETSLGAPLIITGRGDATTPGVIVQAQTGRFAPTRVVIPDLKINAPVDSVGIDLAQGVLDVPANINRTGWWRDGAAPGDAKGAVLIAGHVDSAKAGLGAFNALKNATSRTRVQVTSADGKTRTYKVTSVKAYLKANLPLNVYSTTGPARLVLVTCGGPFNAAIGHYRDNIVVTAVPA